MRKIPAPATKGSITGNKGGFVTKPRQAKSNYNPTNKGQRSTEFRRGIPPKVDPRTPEKPFPAEEKHHLTAPKPVRRG